MLLWCGSFIYVIIFQAVCCDDGKHCCPNGFVCNYTIGACTKKDAPLPWTQMTNENEKTDITVPEKVSDTKTCPGGKITCPQSDNTCCQDGKGGYYCSPYKNVSCDFHFFLYPPQTVFVGGYTVFTLSVRPSVRPSE